MPLMDALESLALGCAAYQSAVNADDGPDDWHQANPFLYHVSRNAEVSKDAAFEAMSKAVVDAILCLHAATAGAAAATPTVAAHGGD
jgi:hypothetical protein